MRALTSFFALSVFLVFCFAQNAKAEVSQEQRKRFADIFSNIVVPSELRDEKFPYVVKWGSPISYAYSGEWPESAKINMGDFFEDLRRKTDVNFVKADNPDKANIVFRIKENFGTAKISDSAGMPAPGQYGCGDIERKSLGSMHRWKKGVIELNIYPARAHFYECMRVVTFNFLGIPFNDYMALNGVLGRQGSYRTITPMESFFIKTLYNHRIHNYKSFDDFKNLVHNVISDSEEINTLESHWMLSAPSDQWVKITLAGFHAFERGDVDGAFRSFKRSFRLGAQEKADDVVKGILHGFMGLTFLTIGDGGQAEKNLLIAIDLIEGAQGPGSVNLRQIYTGLGELYLSLKQYEKAESILEKNCGAGREFNNENLVARCLNFLGAARIEMAVIKQSMEYMDQSFDVLNRAYDIISEAYGDDHYLLAPILHDIGYAHLTIGDVEKGISILKKNKNIYELYPEGGLPEYLNALATLYHTYRELNRMKEAEAALKQSFDSLEKSAFPEKYKALSLGVTRELIGFYQNAGNDNEASFYKDKLKKIQ